MEVVLLKEVKGLGHEGEVKRVADGYARNYLLPRRLAVVASSGARKQIAERAAAAAKREASARAAAEAQAKRLQGVQLTLKARAGEGGRLFGSITNADVATELTRALGQPVDKRKVLLENPIKELGMYQVDVKLHSDVRITVQVDVQAAQAP